jgi:hypothetical protein
VSQLTATDNDICDDVSNDMHVFGSANVSQTNVMENDIGNDDSSNVDIQYMKPFYIKCKTSLKIAHLNINSVRHKFMPSHNILNKGYLDVLFIQESKLDDSFPLQQFDVPSFRQYRKDHTARMGGIMAHVHDDLAQRRRTDLEWQQSTADEVSDGRIESMVLEITIKSEM